MVKVDQNTEISTKRFFLRTVSLMMSVQDTSWIIHMNKQRHDAVIHKKQLVTFFAKGSRCWAAQ